MSSSPLLLHHLTFYFLGIWHQTKLFDFLEENYVCSENGRAHLNRLFQRFLLSIVGFCAGSLLDFQRKCPF